MIRVVIVGAIGFLLGLIGASALVTLKTPQPVTEPVVEAGADGVDHGDEPAAQPEEHASAPRTEARAVDLEEDEAVARPAAAPATRDDAVRHETRRAPDTAGPAGGDTAAASSDGSARLARIFAAMKPDDAARVLEKLDDDEIRSILVHLGDRKAAAVLGNFEADRAATLSRAVIAQESEER